MSHEILLRKQLYDETINIYGTYNDPLFKNNEIELLITTNNTSEYLNLKELLKILKHYNTELTDQLEELVFQVMDECKENLKNELLKYKELVYSEIAKNGHLYLVKTDSGLKVGCTKDSVKKRVGNLQTGNVNDITILFDYKTSNQFLLEKIFHYILNHYRMKSNREFFDCDPEYIKQIITISGVFIHTLASSYHTISNDELKQRLENNLGFVINKPVIVEEKNEETEFFKWLNEHIYEENNGILQVKDICKVYLGIENIHSSISTKYRKDIELYISVKFPKLKSKFESVRIGSKTGRGWKNLALKIE